MIDHYLGNIDNHENIIAILERYHRITSIEFSNMTSIGIGIGYEKLSAFPQNYIWPRWN